MKNKALIIITVTLVLGLVFFAMNFQKNGLVSPNLTTSNQKLEIIPSSSPTPKTFKFDSSTNLKSELETVNPEVTDQDFEEIESILK